MLNKCEICSTEEIQFILTPLIKSKIEILLIILIFTKHLLKQLIDVLWVFYLHYKAHSPTCYPSPNPAVKKLMSIKNNIEH